MAESLLVGRNFMSGICKLKLKKLKTQKPKRPKTQNGKNLGFYHPASHMPKNPSGTSLTHPTQFQRR